MLSWNTIVYGTLTSFTIKCVLNGFLEERFIPGILYTSLSYGYSERVYSRYITPRLASRSVHWRVKNLNGSLMPTCLPTLHCQLFLSLQISAHGATTPPIFTMTLIKARKALRSPLIQKSTARTTSFAEQHLGMETCPNGCQGLFNLLSSTLTEV